MQTTVVEQIRPVARDVVSVVLRAAHGSLEAWEPGAHVDVVLPNWLTRQYSLCGDLDDPQRYRIAVRHDRLSRGGSEYITTFLRRGRELSVSSPRNNVALHDARRYLFLAGGIGITAMMPMMRTATGNGADACLVYTGRSRSGMAFLDELTTRYGDRMRTVITDEDGRPDLAALAARLRPDTLVYCCGPASMLDAAQRAFPADRLRIERFRRVVRRYGPDLPVTVHCARSERRIEVAADESLLDALTTGGVPVASGCREGVCGSCEVRVLAGEPDHRDDLGAAAGVMYPCVSRSLSTNLTLDV